MPDDRRIISLLQKRDERALQIIRETYGSLCFQIAEQIVGNSEDAEECVNDMLMNVWNSIPPQCPVSLRAYLAALVRHAAIDRYKSERRQKRGGAQFAASLDELSEILPSGEQVEHSVEQRALTAALTEWIKTLSPDTARLFIQRYFLSESVREIAKQNEMRESAVKMALLRARGRLKEYLEKEGLL